MYSSGRGRHLTRTIETTAAEIAPVTHRRIHLQNVRQSVAEEVCKFILRIANRARRKLRASERNEGSFLRLKLCVTELERRQCFSQVSVVTAHVDFTQQRALIEWNELFHSGS